MLKQYYYDNALTVKLKTCIDNLKISVLFFSCIFFYLNKAIDFNFNACFGLTEKKCKYCSSQ